MDTKYAEDIEKLVKKKAKYLGDYIEKGSIIRYVNKFTLVIINKVLSKKKILNFRMAFVVCMYTIFYYNTIFYYLQTLMSNNDEEMETR